MVDEIYRLTQDKMEKAIGVTKANLAKIRTGKASPNLLDSVRVNYYGSATPLSQVATINVPEPRLIVIQPWEKKLISDIEKAIQKADLGFNPTNDGTIIRIPIPPLSEERRKELVKVANKNAEEMRVAVRNIRREGNDDLKKAQKDSKITEDDLRRGQKNIEDLTKKYIQKIDDLLAQKEKDIMAV